MLVPARKNVKACVERGRVDGGETKTPAGSPDGDFLSEGRSGSLLLFFRHGTAGFVDDPLDALRDAVGRLTSPMAYSRLRKSYFWVPRRW